MNTNTIINRMKHLSIHHKISIAVLATSALLLVLNMALFWNINTTIRKVEDVYITNISLNELENTIDLLHTNMYDYLNTKSSTSLEGYYTYEQQFRKQVDELQDTISNRATDNAERMVKGLSESYLAKTTDAVLGKRGRDISKYKVSYEESNEIYQYIKDYIYHLNNEQFKINSNNYDVLVDSLRELEVVMVLVFVVVTIINLLLLSLIIRSITNPLIQLRDAADEISKGNFTVQLPSISASDEIGVVTMAFNTMVTNLNHYIKELQERMVYENKMKEKELVTSSLLKDAQLKYYQAQINPHFLFNTLNAGAQLAMMESAEKTCLFIENMAEFFRYNVQMLDKDTTLRGELEVVNHYIYILKGRFGDELQFEQTIDCKRLGEVRMPSMILQPLIENAFNHGIREMECDGKIHLHVEDRVNVVRIIVSDNGIGITKKRLEQINHMENLTEESDSTGIGLSNVMHRLELFYNTPKVLQMESEGAHKGAKAVIDIPMNDVVKDFIQDKVEEIQKGGMRNV